MKDTVSSLKKLGNRWDREVYKAEVRGGHKILKEWGRP